MSKILFLLAVFSSFSASADSCEKSLEGLIDQVKLSTKAIVHYQDQYDSGTISASTLVQMSEFQHQFIERAKKNLIEICDLNL
jgi:hypothetical protein